MASTIHKYTSRLLVMALTCAALGRLATSAGCPKGQVWSDLKARCAPCPTGSVKVPDTGGADAATCKMARQVCGSAEVAKSGSCTKCPATQVATSDIKCASCPTNSTKSPPGIVSNAYCKKRNSSCSPKPEVCNGKDDDCDGRIDEDIPDLFCTPCNKKVPGCRAGKPSSCAGVCPSPCCEDCAQYYYFPSASDKAACLRSCEDCYILRCLPWADSVADRVAGQACEQAAILLGIYVKEDWCSDCREHTVEQCYDVAFDQCFSQVMENAANATSSGACRYYGERSKYISVSGFQKFQREVNTTVDNICNDLALGMQIPFPRD